MKMLEDVKKNWLEALRSGRYLQSRSKLRSESGFCCLGVLCDILDPDAWTNEIFGRKWGPDQLGMVLSDSMLSNLRIPRSVQSTLTNKNDTGHNFNDIADYIEETL